MTIKIMRRSTFFGTGESAGMLQLSMSILRAQIGYSSRSAAIASMTR